MEVRQTEISPQHRSAGEPDTSGTGSSIAARQDGEPDIFVDNLLKLTQQLSALRCGRVVSEDKVAIFRGRVAGETGFVQRLVARLSVLKVSEPPAARRGVLL
jgi:hypothetical protein